MPTDLQYKLLKPLEGQSMRQFNEVRVNKEMQEMRRAIIELQNLYIDSIEAGGGIRLLNA